MMIFDFVLILAVLGCVFALFSLGYFLLRRRWTKAKHVLLGLASFLVLYAAVLLSVSLYSKLLTSPLDTGLEQVYSCSMKLLNAEGERLVSPPGLTN